MKSPLHILALAALLALAATQKPLAAEAANKPPAAEHVLYVDPQAEADGRYVFRSLKEALRQAEQMQRSHTYSDDEPLTVRIAPSVYWIDDPDDGLVRRPADGYPIPYGMVLRLSHLRLEGLGQRPEDTVVASSRGQTQGAEGNFTMLRFEGDDIQVRNLTFGNYCNVDLVYDRDPSLSRPKRAEAIVQAQLIICDGDRVVARDCRFISRLNLCPFAGAKRALFENCYFESTDDALCGTGVYVGCRFTFFSGKPFYSTQGTGAVFLDCDIRSLVDGRQYLVKMGSPVAMVDCRWISDRDDLEIGWTQDPTDDLRSCQYNVTLNGRPITIDARRSHLTIDMTGKPMLEAYRTTLPDGSARYNIYNLLRGHDDWDPAGMKPLLGPDAQLKGSLPAALSLSHRKAEIECGTDTLRLKARETMFFGRADFGAPYEGPALHWSVEPEHEQFVVLEPAADGSCTVTGGECGETVRTVCVKVTDDDGRQAACVVTVRPRQLPPPAFTRTPKIVREGDTLRVDYALELGGREDQSVVTWYRILEDGTPIAVAVSRHDRPKLAYALTPADNGCRMAVTVAPKHLRSQAAEALEARTEAPVQVAYDTAAGYVLKTDFEDFPTQRQPRIGEGLWTLDTYKPAETAQYDWEPDPVACWHYGRGVDGAARAEGLLQTVRGARMMYTPVAGLGGDMEVRILADPGKTAGQGFGSATGQYMDIFIGFDTRKGDGYALRIVRTPQHDRAVEFLIVEYEDFMARPLTRPVAAVCYRSGCTIVLKSGGGRLTAHAETSAPLPKHRPDESERVDLEVETGPLKAAGTGVLHTGSTGASATMLREMEIRWTGRK